MYCSSNKTFTITGMRSNCTNTSARGSIYNTVVLRDHAHTLSPTEVPSDKWASSSLTTLDSAYVTALDISPDIAIFFYMCPRDARHRHTRVERRPPGDGGGAAEARRAPVAVEIFFKKIPTFFRGDTLGNPRDGKNTRCNFSFNICLHPIHAPREIVDQKRVL